MGRYTPPQIDRMLESMEIIVDTREQPTKALRRRIEGFGCPSVRGKLDYGDYSCRFTDMDGVVKDLSRVATIERKMNLDELCNCFTRGRDRFKREFERAKSDGCRVHLIVENDNYESMVSGDYRSNLNPKSLTASFFTWSIRYQLQLHFCKSETTGKLIGEIMHYELREHLLNL